MKSKFDVVKIQSGFIGHLVTEFLRNQQYIVRFWNCRPWNSSKSNPLKYKFNTFRFGQRLLGHLVTEFLKMSSTFECSKLFLNYCFSKIGLVLKIVWYWLSSIGHTECISADPHWNLMHFFVTLLWQKSIWYFMVNVWAHHQFWENEHWKKHENHKMPKNATFLSL